MTSTPHTDCLHPATKAGRAACRKARAQEASRRAAEVEALLDTYFAGEGEAEEIIWSLAALVPEVGTAYLAGTDLEECIALAR